MGLEYRVLGPVEVWCDGRRVEIGGARQQRLIAALVLADGRPMSADRLCDIVWVGEPPERARNTLRTYVARARRALEVDGEAPLHTDTDGWRLERRRDAVDNARFESLVSSARALSGDPMAALTTLDEALVLWRGDAFAGFADEDWCAGEAARLEELRLAAEEARFDAMLGCGLYEDLIGELERFVDRHPLRDRPRGQLMTALYLAGRQVEALRVFQDYRRYLGDEIGVDPSDELKGLEQRIVGRDPSLRRVTPSGRRLRGYELGPLVGEGAFGRIHRATQPSLGREVAIKVIRPELADDAEFIRRFDAEAQTVARLEHPHVVPLYDYWREPGGAYLVMRYLRGGNAHQFVAAHGALSVDRVDRLLGEIGDALATAHGAGVVHRDVKPENILFDEQGRSYLGDFGIATGPDRRHPAGVASTAVAMYMSPEQVDGTATVGSDVYSLGVVLFELLAGRAPFPRDTPFAELVDRKRRGPLPGLAEVRSGLPPDIDGVIATATAPAAGDRFAAVTDLVVAFRTATRDRGNRPRAPLGLAARNPYKGLAPFAEADAHDYFGREELIDRLVAHLSGSPFVAVVGPSGSGKSSLVRAGLGPRLRAGGAYVVSMTPGRHPMRELTRALLQITSQAQDRPTRQALQHPDEGLVDAAEQCLPEPDAELVVVVDQLEELYTVSDAAERDQFVRAVAGVGDRTGRVRVVVTVRADFYDRPLADAIIGALVQDNTVAVAPLGPADLERAVTEPARQVGVEIESALAAALVADASRSVASLPLVQYQLTQLFDTRDGDRLTLAAYESSGGLGGAVARRAEELYEGFDETGREQVRRLFGRLVTPGERVDDTKRRVHRSELPSIASEVIDAYAGARLLTLDRDAATREPTVEIAHEALIREWPRLRRWIDADRDGLRILRHLTSAADEWEASGRDPAELYRGARLVTADDWVARHQEDLTETERGFLEASRRARDVEQERERARIRRLRLLVAGLAALTIAAVTAGAIAYRQRQIADDNAVEADRQRQIADVNADEADRRSLENRVARLATESALAAATDDPDLALLLAVAAHDAASELSTTPDRAVVDALHDAIQASRLESIIPAGFTEIAVHPDGTQVALDHVDATDRVGIYDIATGMLVVDRDMGESIGGLAYSPDGSLLAVAHYGDGNRGPDGPAMTIVDSITLETVQLLDGGLTTWQPSWSSDGRLVLAQGAGGIRIWRSDSPAVEVTIAASDSTARASFAAGEDALAVAARGTLTLFDSTGSRVLADIEVGDGVEGLAVTPDASLVAVLNRARRVVELVDVQSGAVVSSVGHPDPLDVRVSPDARTVSVGGNGAEVVVTDIGTGEIVELRGHGSGSWRHSYTPDGEGLITTSRDGSTRVWNLTPYGPTGLGNLPVDGPTVAAIAPDPSSVLVAVSTGSYAATVERIDVVDRTRRTVTDLWWDIWDRPVFSPDGTLVGGYDPDDLVPVVNDVATGEVVAQLPACASPRAIDAERRWVLVDAYTCPDPSQSPISSGARSGFVDLDTGELLVPVNDVGGPAQAVVGAPGTVAEDVVAYHTTSEVILRSATTFELLASWRIPTDLIALSVELSPDGSQLGMSAQTRQAIVFDVEAILAGDPVDDAVTILDDVSTGPAHRVVPLGEHVATSGAGTEIRRWDLATGEMLTDVATDADGPAFLFALPDGGSVYYQDAGVLRRLVVDVDQLAALARSRTQRGFSPTECDRYFPDGDCPI